MADCVNKRSASGEPSIWNSCSQPFLGCRLEKRLRAAEVRDEQDREARLEEAQAAAKKAREYQSELEHRLQIQVSRSFQVSSPVTRSLCN